jgi:hypothetical protein
VGRSELTDVQAPQEIDRAIEPGCVRVEQVHPTEQGMNRSMRSQFLNVKQGVHHAGVTASQEHHQSLERVEKQSLIVHQRIWLTALLVQEELSTHIIEVR